MRRAQKRTNERLVDELADLDGDGVDLPPRIQAGWRRSDGLPRMPRERDFSDMDHAKRHRARGHTG